MTLHLIFLDLNEYFVKRPVRQMEEECSVHVFMCGITKLAWFLIKIFYFCVTCVMLLDKFSAALILVFILSVKYPTVLIIISTKVETRFLSF